MLLIINELLCNKQYYSNYRLHQRNRYLLFKQSKITNLTKTNILKQKHKCVNIITPGFVVHVQKTTRIVIKVVT